MKIFERIASALLAILIIEALAVGIGLVVDGHWPTRTPDGYDSVYHADRPERPS